MTPLPLCLALALTLLGQEAPRPESAGVPTAQVPVVPAPVARTPPAAHDPVPAGEPWSEDPNRTHYFYAPSGMMLRQGEGSVSLAEASIATVGYGVTDHLTLQAGGIWPGYLLGIVNFMAGARVGGSLGDKVHLAAGAQVLFAPKLGRVTRFTGGGVLHGTATYGTPDAHLSLTATVPFLMTSPLPLRSFLFSLSGNLRVDTHVALVTENWVAFLPTNPGSLPALIPSAGVRFFGTHWALALGVVVIATHDSVAPLPWVDLTYNFGS